MILCPRAFPPPNNFGYFNQNISYYPAEAGSFPFKQEVFQQQPGYSGHHSYVQPNFFHAPNYLNAQVQPHTNYQLPKIENEIKIRQRVQVDKGIRPFTCEICKITFPLNHHLQDHKKTHQNPYDRTKFQCHLCPKVYKRWSTLLSHIRDHQFPRVGFDCEICHRHLTTVVGMKLHMRRHYGQVNYACKLCWKASFSPSEHNRHFRKHWKETPQESMRRWKKRQASLQFIKTEAQDNFPLFPSA